MLSSYFKANDWDVEQNLKRADLVLVSTCGVNRRSEQKSTRLLSIANKKRKADSTLIILGCLPGINEEYLLDRFSATLIPPLELKKLDDIIDAKVKLCEVKDVNCIQPIIDKSQQCFGFFNRVISEFEFSKLFLHRMYDHFKASSVRSFEENAFQIRIAHGCPGECSYCAIKFALGSLVSKPIEKILTEFDTGISDKAKDFVIIAGDVGSYGQDIDANIVELLGNLLSRGEDYQLHLKEFNPRWLIQYEEELLDLFSSNKDKVGTIIVPVQSGSDRILEMMRRFYTAGDTRSHFIT